METMAEMYLNSGKKPRRMKSVGFVSFPLLKAVCNANRKRGDLKKEEKRFFLNIVEMKHFLIKV